MAGGQERALRRRIRSVQSTMKITRAMELIAASRIVRAQQAIAAARPYVAKMAEVVSHLAETPDAETHPLFRQPEDPRRAAIIVITADRGLAGAYNTNVIRATERAMREHREAGREVSLVVVGRKGQSYFRFRRAPVAEAITGVSDRPGVEDARRVVTAVMEPFELGELDVVQLAYTRFKSLGSQEVVVRQLVPLDAAEAAKGGRDGASEQRREPRGPEGGIGRDGGAPGFGEQPVAHRTDYEYEPDPAQILDLLLPRWLEAEVLAAMLDAAASEHAARQRAMAAATDNAEELIKTLRRVMNRARQDAITTEIMEIVGGAEALRKAALGDGSGLGRKSYERT